MNLLNTHSFVWAFCVAGTAAAQVASVSLAGDDATGYYATVGFNPEFGIPGGPGTQSSNPNNPKFFDYPTYAAQDPSQSADIIILQVEPYQFGLDYPNPLHPINSSIFTDVTDDLIVGQPVNPNFVNGEFSEAFTEDEDFHLTDIGTLDYDPTLVSPTGISVIPASQVSFSFDGTEFQAQNRTKISAADRGGFTADDPIGAVNPDGRSNRNEAANIVRIVEDSATFTGTGLTFTGGVLTSIELEVDVDVFAFPNVIEAEPFIDDPSLPLPLASVFNTEGMLKFTGRDFAFEVDGLDDAASGVSGSPARLILNRAAEVDAVRLPGDANGDGTVDLADFGILRANFGGADTVGYAEADFNGDVVVDLADFGILRANFGRTVIDTIEAPVINGSDVAALDAWYATVVPEPTTSAVVAFLSSLALVSRRRRVFNQQENHHVSIS
ncbi:MAG: dockerin type I domain-containing protein [Planctomycetota bacterium]